MGLLKKLDPAVVNRIAAGEIIHRPANVVKELLENALDASCTQLSIEMPSATQLIIRDNGIGIQPTDLPLLCHRHTTSKLSVLSDFSKLQTFGFRGEALASISTISHLKVVTKTPSSLFGYSSTYLETVMSAKPTKCASVDGTQLFVNDLFYNAPERKATLRSFSEEYLLALRVVQRYSLENPAVGFRCHREGRAPDLLLQPGSTVLERIQSLYGRSLKERLLQLSILNTVPLSFRAKGFVSDATFRSHEATFLFFVNGRLVEIEALRRSVLRLYREQQAQELRPFLYLSLEISPEQIDPNVHPTKNKIGFTYEDEIVGVVCRAIQETVFSQITESNTIYSSQLTPRKTGKKTESRTPSENPGKRVRTSHRDQHIRRYYTTPLQQQPPERAPSPQFSQVETKKEVVKPTEASNLHEQLSSNVSLDIQSLLSQSVFVGIVDSKYLALQHKTELYFLNHQLLFYFFYQDFFLKNSGQLVQKAVDPLPLPNNTRISAETETNLHRHFSIKIQEGQAIAFPLDPLGNPSPSYSWLCQRFFVFAANTPNLFFKLVLEELAVAYTPKVTLEEIDYWTEMFENNFFPTIKERATQTLYGRELEEKPNLVKACDMPGLYRIFER